MQSRESKSSTESNEFNSLKENEKSTSQVEENVTRIPLPPEYNSEAIAGGMAFDKRFLNFITTPDRIMTMFQRWPGVFQSVFTGQNSVGLINEILSANPELAGVYLGSLVVLGFISDRMDKEERKRNDREKQNIFKKLMSGKEENESDQKIVDLINGYAKNFIIEEFNEHIRKIISKDKDLSEKYDSISIDPETSELVFKRNPPKKKFGALRSVWEHAIKPLYTADVVASVAFWILWIGGAAITGQLLDGLAGVPTWVAAGLPASFGVVSLAHYGYNALKYGGFEKARQHAEASADFDVMLKAILHREHKHDMQYLKQRHAELEAACKDRGIRVSTEELKKASKIFVKPAEGFLDKSFVKGAFALVTSTTGKWGGSQTLFTYAKVVIETVFIASMFAPLAAAVVGSGGAALLGLACVYGVYKGYQRYKEAKDLKKEWQAAEQSGKPMKTLKELEDHYKDRERHFERLKEQIQKYKQAYGKTGNAVYDVDIARVLDTPEKNPEKPKGLWNKFIGGCIAVKNNPQFSDFISSLDITMPGVFLGRMLFAGAASITLLTLTGGVGLAAILGVGAVYWGIKTFENYQKRKEARIKQLPDQLEVLEKNIRTAELAVEDMVMSEAIIRKDVVDSQTILHVDKKTHTPTVFRKLFGKAEPVMEKNRYPTSQPAEEVELAHAASGVTVR